MSKLSMLQGKSKTYKIGPIELELIPLGIDDMGAFDVDESSSPKEQIKATIEMVNKVLTEAVPDSTPEERKKIGLKYMTELMAAIKDVNGINKQGNKIDAIKAKQAALQNKGK